MKRSDMLKEIFGKRYGVESTEFDVFLELNAEALDMAEGTA